MHARHSEFQLPADGDGLEPAVVVRAPDGGVLVLQRDPHCLHRPQVHARCPDPLASSMHVRVG